MTVLNRIWGGRLTQLRVDAAVHRVRLVISTVTGAVEDVCEIVCSEVREMRLFDESMSVWDYVEITAASARPMPDGSMVLELTMWTEEAGLMIRCGEITVDGEALSFNGC
ncbi:MAG: hypothetical protein GXP34_04740 [Actinobacteria bacterium]|nr:hypothetical protein [Actinomycetota bacterium]